MSAACINNKHYITQPMHIIKYIDTIKIIKYLNVLEHVSDHIRSIIREPCVKNYKNDRIIALIFSQELYKTP